MISFAIFGTRVTAARVVRTSAYYNSVNFRSPDGAKSHLTHFIYVSLLTQNCKSKLNRKREKRKKLIWGPFIKYQISHTSGQICKFRHREWILREKILNNLFYHLLPTFKKSSQKHLFLHAFYSLS